MRLTMVGTGYVGLVTGVCLSNTGNDVTCLDVDPAKIDTLREGGCPIYEPGLAELMAHNTQAGRLRFTTDTGEAYRDAEAIFICVGTPTGPDGKTDMSYVWAAADAIGETIKTLGPNQGPKLVVVKSTVPVGTTLRVKERIAAIAGDIPFGVANNPEFLKEGAAVHDFNHPDRVVCGVDTEHAGNMMRNIYNPLVRQGNPIFVMDILSSEMVKYASNNFLATKISFINEMAGLCEAFGADIGRVRAGMCADKRIGNQFLYPGLGYGGSCFPKDTLACIAMGDENNLEMNLSQAVHDVNQRQRRRFFQRIESHFVQHGGIAGKVLAFWGMAFKPQTDDIREAPAVDIMKWAKDAGAKVRGFDPVAAANVEKEHPGAFEIVPEMYATLNGADALVICTEWNEFRSPDFAEIKARLRHPVVFDGRNLYEPEKMLEMGIIHHSIGRPPAAQETLQSKA